jgi:hypothetical protein
VVSLLSVEIDAGVSGVAERQQLLELRVAIVEATKDTRAGLMD